jgi:hypothetical protein
VLYLKPANYRNGSIGPTISVELDDDGHVSMVLEPQTGETFDDRDVERSLVPAEARELAAALWHYAEESERRR